MPLFTVSEFPLMDMIRVHKQDTWLIAGVHILPKNLKIPYNSRGQNKDRNLIPYCGCSRTVSDATAQNLDATVTCSPDIEITLSVCSVMNR